MKPAAKTQTSEDLRIVLESVRNKVPVPTDVADRVRMRSDRIIDRLQSQPPTDVAVELIRDVRDE